MTDKITNILGYESTKTGANVILKFKTWITRRKLITKVLEHPKKCSLSGREIPVGSVVYYVSIKKRGYSTYWLSQEAVNEALNGEYTKKSEAMDADLREALANIKYKNSKLGAKMGATHKLLELVSGSSAK